MADNDITKTSSEMKVTNQSELDHLLVQMRAETLVQARLIFALDATASRQPTWDMACDLQAQMFAEVANLGTLQVQLVFYRGQECRASNWMANPAQLAKAMRSLVCMGGMTQIGKVLSHVFRENTKEGVAAVVFVGDPLLLFSVLYGFWTASYVAFNGDLMREVAAQVLTLAEKQGAIVPLMLGHRLMANSLLVTGDIAESRTHYDQAIALYDPAEHRQLATRFGQDAQVSVLSYRAIGLWLLGYPEAARADTERALKYAREINQPATILFALLHGSVTDMLCGDYAAATAKVDEIVTLADEKGQFFWKAPGVMNRGCVLILTGNAHDAVQIMTSGITAFRSTGSTLWMPWYLAELARAYAQLDRFDDAWRCIGEAMAAMDTTKERWREADIHRIAGEIALTSPERDVAKAEACFERALAIAREQKAKSWELRAAISMAQLWRDQGKRNEARELLAPIYCWFTEGFDTRDLKEAKALLDKLS